MFAILRLVGLTARSGCVGGLGHQDEVGQLCVGLALPPLVLREGRTAEFCQVKHGVWTMGVSRLSLDWVVSVRVRPFDQGSRERD